MIANFSVIPYVGVGPISLGMSRAQLHALLGVSDTSKKSRFDSKVIDHWLKEDLTVISSAVDGAVVEISFGNVQMAAEVQGIKFFDRSGPDVYRDLCNIDGAPRADVGITVLFKLGLTLDGFTTTDQEDRVVTIFAKGVWNENDQRLKPIRL